MQEDQQTAVSIIKLLLEEAEKTAPAGVLEWDQYQDMRRRIIASVRVCATLPTQVIESMPAAGVRGLADSHAEIYAIVALVKQAASDDTAWANLRKGILGAQAEMTH